VTNERILRDVFSPSQQLPTGYAHAADIARRSLHDIRQIARLIFEFQPIDSRLGNE
jgi:hypothetical protein